MKLIEDTRCPACGHSKYRIVNGALVKCTRCRMQYMSLPRNKRLKAEAKRGLADKVEARAEIRKVFQAIQIHIDLLEKQKLPTKILQVLEATDQGIQALEAYFKAEEDQEVKKAS